MISRDMQGMVGLCVLRTVGYKNPTKTPQLTSLLQTTSSPNYILTVLLLTVRSMNVKVLESSTSN